MNDNYKEKYFKYKTKYNLLKSQIGGMGFHTYFWNQHPDFEKFNINASRKIQLLEEPEGTQFEEYSILLDRLLQKENGLINMDFINNFFRYIYYDIDGRLFGLDKIDDTFKWRNPSINKYKITKIISQPHLNTTIIFLSARGLANKVLKIFNSIPINIGALKDYLSLEITHIQPESSRVRSFQENYNSISREMFDKINFNMQTNLIKSQDGNDLYLSCRNNDAINDYIINLILQKINQLKGGDINIVTYDNLFVTQINGEYKYCILMEQMEDSLNAFINELPRNSFDILYPIFDKIERDLNKLKTMDYLFTHTDLKCENIFYKTHREDAIIPYLADFDKSSITFHNIRFYNDITQSGGVKSTVDPMSFLSAFLVDAYTIKKEQDRKEDIFNYRLSRIGSSSLFTTVEGIETEQTYMRYNYMPYYTSFDMCSLLLSLFNMKKKDDSGPIFNKLPPSVDNLFRLLIRYINSDKLELLMSKYNIANIPKGDFGKLLSLILQVKEEIGECFIHVTDKTLKNPYINKLYLSNQRKICLSIPFTPISALKDSKTNTSVFKFNIDKTNTLYGKLLSTEIIEKYKTIQVEYNTDYAVGAAKGVFGLKDPDIIIITNRYSMLTTLYGKPITYINDYDDVQSDKVKEIFDFIMTTSNTLD